MIPPHTRGRVMNGHVVPWNAMTREQQVDHLRYGHGFGVYERGGPWQEVPDEDTWGLLETWPERDLVDLHVEDHLEVLRGRSWDTGLCDSGPLHHDHEKEVT